MIRSLRLAFWPTFVIVMALLVAVAPAVAGTNTGALINTTDTDFNAGTLTDVSVVGSGTAADVEFSLTTFDNFEDNNINEYQGDTGDYSTQSATVKWGTYALKGSNPASTKGIGSTSGLGAYPAQGDDFTGWVYLGGGGANARIYFGLNDASWTTEPSDTYYVDIDKANSRFRLVEIVSGSKTALAADTGVTIPSGEWLRYTVEWAGTGQIDLTLYNAAGTQISSVSDTDNSFSSGGLGFGHNGADVFFDNVKLDSPSSGHYISANHSVTDPNNGFTDLTLANTTANVTWQEFTGGSWSVIRTDSYTTSGNKTVDISSASSSTLRVNVSFDTSTGVATGELHDEGVTFTNHAPEFDNSTATPTGGTLVNEATVTFSIQLNDTEFGTAQGDSVDVTFYVNSSQVGTNNSITSNGTVTFDYTATIGGDREWSVVATDNYGGSNVSDNFTFTVPSQLQIREETSPHDLITSATVTVKFFENTQDSPTIVERTTTDGNVSLAGLPVNGEFVATVRTDGYYNRTVVIKDIFDQNTIFLLNKSRTVINNTFVLDDGTGDFSSEDNVTFFIQKAINQSEYDTGGWAWITVSGDNLGGQQLFYDTLEFEDRYRLRIENGDGDSRVLGEYNAQQGGIVTLSVGAVNITPTKGSTYAWNATYNDSGSNFIRFSFNDTVSGTTDLNLTVYEWGNESNVLATDLNNAGPFGTFSFSQQVTGDDVNKTWVVEWNATKNGTAIGGSEVVGRQTIGPTLPLDAVWLEVGSVGLLVLTAGAVGGLLNPAVGALVLAMLGGMLWQLGFLPAEIGGGAIVLALLVAGSWLVIHSRSEP